MKKKIIYSLLVVCFFAFDASFAAKTMEQAEKASVSVAVGKPAKGKKKKNGRYKKKRGLFGKKNDCGCPKH